MNTQERERLTAFVLGELDELEAAQVVARIETDPEAAALVEELREAARLTETFYAGEALPELGDERRAQVRAARENVVRLDADEADIHVSGRPSRLVMLLAAMALIAVGAGLLLVKFEKVELHTAAVLSDEALEAQRMLEALPEGVERFLITDINNPVATVMARESLFSADALEDPAVQQQIQSLYDRMGTREPQHESAPQLIAFGTAPRPAPKPESRAPRISLQELAEMGGSIRIRGDWYDFSQADSSLGRSYSDDFQTYDLFLYQRPAWRPTDSHVAPRLNPWPGHNTEAYDRIQDNPFLAVTQNPLSTFSIDVDTASYSNVRRFLNQGTLPPPDAVRIEEMLNYFSYEYAPPEDLEKPFAAHVTVAQAPWNPAHRLARIGIKGWELKDEDRPASNLVFLIDVSGSMRPANRLPLVKQSLRLLVKQLDERDSVAMVVYAGSSGLVLPPTTGDNRQAILEALDRLEAGGSTHGSAGIQLAYETAIANFIPGGTNRVILATDGDFNVGTTSTGELVRMVEEKAKSGVFLTVLGYGMGNVRDSMMEQLSNSGNGNYAYIDTLQEARKVLVEQMHGTLVTIAKDVKIQVEFNPAQVSAYRLIGYENRLLRPEDFNDDTKDAGEIGAGHTVTALYELVPAGVSVDTPPVDPLRYQPAPASTAEMALSNELFTLKLRYKEPEGDLSALQEFPVRDSGKNFAAADADFKFAAAVAGFGMLLRDSEHGGNLTLDAVRELAGEGLGEDTHGYRREFLELVEKTRQLQQ